MRYSRNRACSHWGDSRKIDSMHIVYVPLLAGRLARLAVAAVLIALAPVVEAVCGTLMLLGLLVSVAFELSAARAHFPFWPMVTLSLGFGVALVVYHALIDLLSR
jgi:hypothetical protein